MIVLFAVLARVSERPGEDRVSMLAAEVSGHGGDVVKRLSDGVMAVFRSPADAVSCALAMQRSTKEQGSGAVTLRVGLSAGEPLVQGKDYFGTPVVIARRLCDKAEGGQILCASLISRFKSAHERAAFRSLGPLDLKGIATPVPASEVLEHHAD